jgi:hypothetical protein
MRIIFLDIDGVLNSENWFRRRFKEVDKYTISADYPYYEFDPLLVKNLNKIIQETDAKVVVSSTWRIGRTKEELQEILNMVGFEGEIIGKTLHLGGIKGYTIPRGCEIDYWLKGKKFQRINWDIEKQKERLDESEVKNYVILDDDSDMLYNQREHFVKTGWQDGLCSSSTDIAIEILKNDLISLYY